MKYYNLIKIQGKRVRNKILSAIFLIFAINLINLINVHTMEADPQDDALYYAWNGSNGQPALKDILTQENIRNALKFNTKKLSSNPIIIELENIMTFVINKNIFTPEAQFSIDIINQIFLLLKTQDEHGYTILHLLAGEENKNLRLVQIIFDFVKTINAHSAAYNVMSLMTIQSEGGHTPLHCETWYDGETRFADFVFSFIINNSNPQDALIYILTLLKIQDNIWGYSILNLAAFHQCNEFILNIFRFITKTDPSHGPMEIKKLKRMRDKYGQIICLGSKELNDTINFFLLTVKSINHF